MTRTCGPCTACCTALNVNDAALKKPRNARCEHLCATGCRIYETRPVACAEFRCGWLKGWGDETDRPDLLGVIVEEERDGVALSCAPGFDIDCHEARTVEAMFLATKRYWHVQVYDRERARFSIGGVTRTYRIVANHADRIGIEEEIA